MAHKQILSYTKDSEIHKYGIEETNIKPPLKNLISVRTDFGNLSKGWFEDMYDSLPEQTPAPHNGANYQIS